MKTTKSKLAILVSAICSGALLVASGLSAAWFYKENNIDLDEGLTGSVLQKYFHDGDGSEEHPFIITRPRHYENMVLLHYNLEGFAEKEFYFEIGTDLDGDPKTIEVYNYKDGKVDNSEGNGYSTTLNCDRIASLAPLGSLKKPFNAHIQGNNMTVSGFQIDATRDKFMDIGIFGFVGHGTCLNTYFSDFVIDTTGTEYKEPTTEEINNDTAHIHQKGAVHFGYIAGHLDETGNFQNVYVNNCTLKGTTNGLHVNNYGYYGRAEQDALGGGLGVGRDYQFSLNSQAVYNYFNTTYDTIKDNQLVLRNTRYTEDSEPNENGDKVKRAVDKGQNIVKFSSAISPDSAAGSVTYLINDEHSLSTTGYASPEFREIRRNYNVYYTDREYDALDGSNHSHDGNVKTPSTEPSYKEETMRGTGQGLVVDSDTGEEHPTTYYYFDEEENRYYYGESYDRKYDSTKDTKAFNCKINFKDFTVNIPETLQANLTSGYVSVVARLYFDNVKSEQSEYFDIPLSVKENGITQRGNGRNYSATFTANNAEVVIPGTKEGTHFVSAIIRVRYQYDTDSIFGFVYNRTYHYETYVYGTYGNDSKLSQNSVLVNDERKGFVLDFNDGLVPLNEEHAGSTKYNNLTANKSQNVNKQPFADPSPDADFNHVDMRTFETPLLYKIINDDGTEQTDFAEIPELTINDHTSFTYEETTHAWLLSIIRREAVQNSESKEYFSAEETIIRDSGYRSKNIDVVGGGAEFYYQSILGRGIAVLSLTSERTAGQLCKPAPAKGEQFYATERCKSSIVVYLKNTSNPLDGRDDTLGKISFTFVRPKIFGYTPTVVDPVFKKGNAFMSLNKAGTNIVESQDNNFISLTHNISLDLLESDVQKVSYCALDAEGKVLGTYNSDGTTTMTKEEQVKIDTYILVLGGQANNGNDTWITNIDFEYKAQDGYGGTFGSIGYRSATDTIDNTILNYYLENPSTNGSYTDYTYSVNVKYVKNTEEPAKGTYYITCYADTAVTLKIFNYYSTSYDVYVKSTPTGEFVQATGATPNILIPASQESTW